MLRAAVVRSAGGDGGRGRGCGAVVKGAYIYAREGVKRSPALGYAGSKWRRRRVCLLPGAKLADPGAARSSVRRLAALQDIDAVLVGDGWPVFRHGAEALRELVDSFDAA